MPSSLEVSLIDTKINAKELFVVSFGTLSRKRNIPFPHPKGLEYSPMNTPLKLLLPLRARKQNLICKIK